MTSISETDTVATALRTAVNLVPETFQGLVIVYQRGSEVLCGVCQPLGLTHAELGHIPVEADGAVLIAICDHDHVISRSISELDTLASQVEHARMTVRAEVHVSSLRAGDHWTDLIDLDHPGGTVPAATSTAAPSTHPGRWLHPFMRGLSHTIAPRRNC
ncbi:hypothetical protein ACFXG4_30350 [Nocardia sp. NPDC059246]|uniref:hypothetical protein n=1 Tax=unclassified Nocardia TaxID=2637762 RepID=UPI0036C2F52F